MVMIGRGLWLAGIIALLANTSAAEWKYDENALNGCICYYSCGQLGGWDCASVSCGYNPKPSDASPACLNTAGGPCMCSGWGCGRTQMLKSGKYYEQCLDQNAKPVCGDGKCENRKDEGCKNCPQDCGCFSSAECTGKDPKDERGCTDKCAGIECKSKCDGDTLSYGGKCDRGLKGCLYKTTKCKNGCDNSSWGGAKCKPEDDKCKGVVCDGQCDYDGTLWFDGECNKSSGQCVYTQNATCPKGCTGQDKCVGQVDGAVHYNDATRIPAGVDEPLRNVKIRFEYTDKDGIEHVGKDDQDPEFYVWTDDYGRFKWNYAPNFDPDGTLNIIINFDNQKKKFYMVAYDDVTTTLDLYFEKYIDVTDKKLKSYDVNLKNTPLANNQALAEVGKKYVGLLRAVEYKENNFRKDDTVRERVMMFKPAGSAFHGGDAWKAESPDDRGIMLPLTRTAFNHPAAPLTEWHEYGHHIQDDELFAVKRNIPGSDHGGFKKNPTSEYGFLEGWATWVAMTMKRDYALGGPGGQYEVANSVYNIENNFNIKSTANSVDEELAIAGIMWDLIDSNADYNGPDDDPVSIWPFQVYDVIASKGDWGGGKGVRYVETLRDFYIALNATGESHLIAPYAGNANITNLDYIFLTHGAYQDKNNNSRWDDGEQIGWSGKFLNFRRDLEYEPGTEVKLNIKDQNGESIKNLYAQVEVDYGDTYTRNNRTYAIPIVDDFVAVPLVPEEYNASFTIAVMQGGSNKTSKETFKITNRELYKKKNPGKPLGTLTATIRTSPIPCKTDQECQYWMAGQTCDNKTSTCAGQAGVEKLDKVECGHGIRCQGEKNPVLGGLGGGLGDVTSKLPCCNFLSMLPLAALAAAIGKAVYA